MEHGVKELMELVDAVEVVGVKIAGAAKDGLQLQDALVLLDAEVYDKVKVAVDGMSKVDDELKDLDWLGGEGAQVLGRMLSLVSAIVAATKVAEEAKA